MPKCPSHICALIPTYNNAGTLADVLRRTYHFVEGIIVVNDGSTDGTQQVLQDADMPLHVVQLPVNRGKGYALREGFRKAKRLGFTHVITLDSDGQHLPEQIPALTDLSLMHPKAIIVGSRTLAGKDINAGSLFANKFSNFWFTVQTGLRLPDTQSGMRVYPLEALHGLNFITARYEAELELLVWAAWANVKIMPCPIDVFYPPQEERVSHFKPAKDFTRISLLNTVLCLLALIYGLPRRYWRSIYFGTVVLLVVVPFVIVSIVYDVLKGLSIPVRDNYHRLFSNICRLLIALMPPGSRVKRLPKITDTTPAVYIANHNSLLDTLAMMSVNPKVVILSRRWVCNHPLFGIIARTADFPSADEGVDVLLDELKPLIEDGYSLLIFPEGSRSRDGRLASFHAGAFYIAQKLKLPVQPFLLHNFYEALSHNEFRLGKAKMTVDMMPLLSQQDVGLANYRQLAIKMHNEYLKLLTSC